MERRQFGPPLVVWLVVAIAGEACSIWGFVQIANGRLAEGGLAISVGLGTVALVAGTVLTIVFAEYSYVAAQTSEKNLLEAMARSADELRQELQPRSAKQQVGQDGQRQHHSVVRLLGVGFALGVVATATARRR